MTASIKSSARTADGQEAAKQSLPLFYDSLVPLNSHLHGDIAATPVADYRFAAQASVIPIVLSEAAIAQAHYPVVFTTGEKPVPVVIVGTPQNGNRFVDRKGNWKPGAYCAAEERGRRSS